MLRTSTLTRGERMLVSRRRKAESQIDAAARYNVSLYAYRQWETEALECPHALSIGKLKPFEQCFLLRRRKGVTAGTLARKLGLSRWWLCQMERGDVDAARLVKFWRGDQGGWGAARRAAFWRGA